MGNPKDRFCRIEAHIIDTGTNNSSYAPVHILWEVVTH